MARPIPTGPPPTMTTCGALPLTETACLCECLLHAARSVEGVLRRIAQRVDDVRWRAVRLGGVHQLVLAGRVVHTLEVLLQLDRVDVHVAGLPDGRARRTRPRGQEPFRDRASGRSQRARLDLPLPRPDGDPVVRRPRPRRGRGVPAWAPVLLA